MGLVDFFLAIGCGFGLKSYLDSQRPHRNEYADEHVTCI